MLAQASIAPNTFLTKAFEEAFKVIEKSADFPRSKLGPAAGEPNRWLNPADSTSSATLWALHWRPLHVLTSEFLAVPDAFRIAVLAADPRRARAAVIAYPVHGAAFGGEFIAI